MIAVTELKGDKQQTEICKLYWSYREDKFVYHLQDIASNYGLTRAQVEEIAAKNCIAYWQEYVCSICKVPLMIFADRQDFNHHLDEIIRSVASQKANGDLYFCKDCCQKRPVNLNQANSLEITGTRRDELDQAFYEAEYFHLDNLALSFLKILARSNNYAEAVKQAKLRSPDAAIVMESLLARNLVTWSINKLGYWMVPQLFELLKKNKQALRSPFRSIKELKIYSILKQKHLFVYPRVPLSAFVASDQIKVLFAHPWHKAWFLTYEFDFVICNREGVPLAIVELDENIKRPKQREQFIDIVLERLQLPRMRELEE